ncbi:MAG: winged helix-turn-helix transcriptional regulator [Planctomycetota bacterium]|nr:winged helix-turn-helix transcriptional regulator [Planctomycetota bacterium]
MTTNKPPILAGCAVLAPLNSKRKPPKSAPANEPKQPSKSRDRFKVLNNFVDFTMGKLKADDVRVWFMRYRDTKDGTAATAQTDIARRAGVSVRAVHGSVKRLERLGLLKVIYRGGLNRGSSRYRVAALID